MKQMQSTCTMLFYKDGKLVCRGAGDSHLPRSLRARSPHGLFPSAVPPLTDEERSSESRRDSASPQGIPPELSNLILQVLAIERIGPLRRGDFVLRTTNLRSWIAADAKHLHQDLKRRQTRFAGVQVILTCRYKAQLLEFR